MSSEPSADWVRVTLAELIEVRHGFAFSGEFFTDDPTAFVVVTPGNFGIRSGFQATKLKYYKTDGPIPEEFVLNPCELIVTMTDLSREADTLVFAARIPDSGDLTYLHNQRIGKVVARNGSRVDLSYIHWLLRSPHYRHHVVATATGTTVKHTSPIRICEYSCALPPLDEQRRIATGLGALDDKIAHNKAVASRVREVADVGFRERFLASPARSRRALGDVVSLQKTSVAPAERPAELFEHFSIPAFDDGGVPSREPGAGILSTKTRLPERDVILFSKLNPATPRVWWPRPSGTGDAVCSSEFLVLVPDAVPATFLYASLRNDSALYEEIISHATGTTGSRQRVKPTDVLGCSMIGATQDEFESYDAFARPLHDLDAVLLRESQHLGAIRDALLPKLVSGAIRVPESYDASDAQGTVE